MRLVISRIAEKNFVIFIRSMGVKSIVSDIDKRNKPVPYCSVAELISVGAMVSGTSVITRPNASTKLFPAKSLKERGNINDKWGPS